MSILGHLAKFFLIACLVSVSCRNNPAKPIGPYTTPFEWPTSTPEAQGLNIDRLDEGMVAAENLGYVKSFLVICNGFLVKESYFHNSSMYSSNVIHSVSKSFLSAFTGIALEKGDLTGLDQTVFDYFTQYDYPGFDERKKGITVKHLLTMKAGFAGDHDIYGLVSNSSNWIGATWQLPLIAAPGQEFHYNTFETHLLSAMLTEVTGMSTLNYANAHFFSKLGISCDAWEQGPSGYYFGGNNMYFTTRDMACLGLLYLQNGTWNGTQVVPAKWVHESLRYTHGGTSTWGAITEIGYGYLWWLGKMNGHSLYMALGWAGQFVVVFPDFQLIIAANSQTTPSGDIADTQERAVLQIMADYILPALEGN